MAKTKQNKVEVKSEEVVEKKVKREAVVKIRSKKYKEAKAKIDSTKNYK